MKKNLSSNRNMYQVVINILTFFAAIWSGIPSFAAGVDSFKKKVNDIDDTAEQQINSIKYTHPINE